MRVLAHLEFRGGSSTSSNARRQLSDAVTLARSEGWAHCELVGLSSGKPDRATDAAGVGSSHSEGASTGLLSGETHLLGHAETAQFEDGGHLAERE
jgi:hypothetical protein